ncbi:MAG: methyltransferase [Acidobacteria bacterium]|nr:methyltransferase [Acidobacteriota bacterium]
MDDRRPALDVRTPAHDVCLTPLIDALLDDFDPFAIEELDTRHRRVHFFSSVSRDEAARALGRSFRSRGVAVRAVDVPHGDWAARSQAGLRAVQVGDIVVAPPWDVPAAATAATLVVIRPSMGFGTGHHASTRLCLRALQALALGNRHVLDLGTGSGVLAIASALRGARTVLAVDIDADAVETARANVGLNDVGHIVQVRRADVRRAGVEPAAGVVANIHAALACRAAGALAGLVSAGGTLVVGGVTGGEEEDVRRALAPYGALHARYTEDEWVALAIRV